MRKDICEFQPYKRAKKRGVPFLCKTADKGKCHVHWSDGSLSDYDIFQRILSGALGKHMESQILPYFDGLDRRSKAEFVGGDYSGYFGPVRAEIASDVFSIVQFHFTTALEWMTEAEATFGSISPMMDQWLMVTEFIDRKNSEFAEFNNIENDESEAREHAITDAPWVPGEKEPQMTDTQTIAYRVFELIEPTIKQAIAQAIEEHFK